MQICLVDLRRLIYEQASLHFQPGGTEMRETFTGNFWIEILDWRNDAFDSRRDQRVGAWRRAAMMGMRFE